jgi:DNA-binding GntR family transcriptional regulator
MDEPKFETLDVMNLRTHIEIQIRKAILSGAFSPGQRLVESAIADGLGVSRAPVREVLSALEREGLVVSYPRRGYFVVEFSEQDISEIYSLRVALETLAVQHAIERLTPTDAHELQAMIDELGLAIRNKSGPDVLVELDLEFHDRIVRVADHSRLYSAWNNIRMQTSMLIGITSRTPYDYPDQPRDFHQTLLNALKDRELNDAVESLREHILDAERRAMPTLRSATAAD